MHAVRRGTADRNPPCVVCVVPFSCPPPLPPGGSHMLSSVSTYDTPSGSHMLSSISACADKMPLYMSISCSGGQTLQCLAI